MEKGTMNLNRREPAQVEDVNVVSLFGNFSQSESILNDPLRDLIEEAQIEDEVLLEEEVSPRKLVTMNQFPEDSMFILEDQLSNLKSSLNRMKFLLGELEDILPVKNL